MTNITKHWDYLIITAANDSQAASYRTQLELRKDLGFLPYAHHLLVVPDPDGKRIGSGTSTLLCLAEVLSHQLKSDSDADNPSTWQTILEKLRILIIHAGGDSQRLPAYGPSGKIFMPVPGPADTALPTTLFDRQIPTYLALPALPDDTGQIVITSGDVLLNFDPAQINFSSVGLTGLGSFTSSQQAASHGVLCRKQNSTVTRFLQKPTIDQQQNAGAIESNDQTIVDIGVMSFDAATAVTLLKTFATRPKSNGTNRFSGELGQAILGHTLDFYREICCALGTNQTLNQYLDSLKQSGSTWPQNLLKNIFQKLRTIPFHVHVVPRLDLLHFGTTGQIIKSAAAQLQLDHGSSPKTTCININNEISDKARLTGKNAWVEACRLNATLTCKGQNLVVGADIDKPLTIPTKMCLDIIKGRDRNNNRTWFIRCYGISDTFKDPLEKGVTFCNIPANKWLKTIGASPEDIWALETPPENQTLWNARLFPAVPQHTIFYDWLWMFEPSKATSRRHRVWLSADRYSLAEINLLTDQHAFHQRRNKIHAEAIQNSLQQMFCKLSRFSAKDLTHLLKNTDDISAIIADLLSLAHHHYPLTITGTTNALTFPRIIHTTASALQSFAERSPHSLETELANASKKLKPNVTKWLKTVGLDLKEDTSLKTWTQNARSLAFKTFGRTIIQTSAEKLPAPKTCLPTDQLVWGRAPARLDIGGGWTDTPPYSLEFGGCVVNLAVDLNGQPPIQACARLIDQPLIRIKSIDLETEIEITKLSELLDYAHAESGFALTKAALALSGFAPTTADSPRSTTLKQILENFGGGLELTTSANIPKGSGLGTSSIMGAVLLNVIGRTMGRKLTQHQIFHAVLQLEQALTTGGGWQDQIGGATPAVKIITTQPEMVPDARICALPPDLLDPKINNGQTLLYYTGITRLAKNILEQIVSRVLNRNRLAMNTLRQIHTTALLVAEALANKDIIRFGRLIDQAWILNKQLDPNSSNLQIEDLLQKVKPHIFGAKLLGAGGGGFLFMVCKSPADAKRIRKLLTKQPPNNHAQFFDYRINHDGLLVTLTNASKSPFHN